MFRLWELGARRGGAHTPGECPHFKALTIPKGIVFQIAILSTTSLEGGTNS